MEAGKTGVKEMEGHAMGRLTSSGKLYGRERDIVTMLESFERAGRGHGEVLMVPGPSGVGKTALVYGLQKPVLERNGFFLRGKFEQYQQNVPYFAFRQALTGLCRELERTEQRLRFKADILQAIGNLGQVMVDMAPELELFLGAQPPLPEISPQEAKHRFAEVFRNFFGVICRPEHPLVLFIDDWQWADPASLELLQQIQAGIALRYLLLVVSYRDDEVNVGHPLLPAIEVLRSHGVPVVMLPVQNITAGDVQEMVAGTLQPAVEDIEGLAAVIYGKTLGNPFFARSLLIFLNETRVIWFDNARDCWQWRMDKPEEAGLPGSLVELFFLKLRRLDTVGQNLFSLAACLGTRFDIETLSKISGIDPGVCLMLLFSEPAKGLLFRWEGGGGFSSPDLPATKVCTFRHDQVQQAAYSLIDHAELPHVLLKIGRMLLANLTPEQFSDKLPEVVNDLNAGYDLIQDHAVQVKVFELNILAARQAYTATAYSSALQYYRAAARFLEKPGLTEHLWCDHHELTLGLFNERAECEFLEGDREEAERCVGESVAHSRTAIEKAGALNILIVQFTLLAMYSKAIAAGRQALAALGVSLPEEDYDAARNVEIALVRQDLKGRSVASLAELPIMSDPAMLMAAKVLITMGPPCYRSHQRLWSVIVPKVVNLTLRYGNIPQVGYSHTAFGGLLAWVDSDYATAREFGELATRLMSGTRFPPSAQSVFYLMVGSSIRHWFKHLRHATQDYKDAYETGLRSGNLQYAAYAFGHNMYCQFYQGVPLADLIRETQRTLAFSRTRVNQWAVDILEGGLNIFGALSETNPLLNEDDPWFEDAYLQRVENHHNIQVTCIYKVLKTFSLLLSGNDEGALALSDETEPLIYTVGTQGLLPWPEHVFVRLLILTSLYAGVDGKQQARWRAEIDLMMSKLRIWADNCPENFEHKYLLAAAELARIDDRPIEAMQLYDSAIEAAQAGNFLQWAGMANERAHRFWLDCGNERLAQVYWQQAYLGYDRWGAVAKVRSLETAYRISLAESIPASKGSGKPDGRLEQEIKNVLVEKQIKQLRNSAAQTQQTDLRIEAANRTEELANALQRLRVETAERRKVEEELQEAHDHLEMRVAKRTKQLQREITARQQTEEALSAAKLAAEAANRAKSTFLANMSHEIRTPMSGVLGMTGLLLNTPLTSQQRNYAEKIRTSGTSLLAVINDILDFSKIEAGKMALESIPFSVEAVISNVVNLFEPLAAEKKVELYTTLDPELPDALLGDPRRLTQVLGNLLGNAVKFTQAGFIRLTTKTRKRTGENTELEISVQDTGIGMTGEELSRLFKSFSQADASMTRRYGGTGLGLAISRSMVELMGGTLNVESASGKGSLFTILISFPVATELASTDLQSAPVHSQISRPARFTGVQVLVVEDHVINREIVVELLRQLGIEADTAVNGREAVAMVRAKEFDIVLMDIQMPEMDGIEATREIRKVERAGVDRMPIIAMTAHALAGDRAKSLAAGMNDHISKPINPNVLEAALRQWLPPEKCAAVAADTLDTVTNPDLLSIPPLPGLDVVGGLERLGGNRELYLKLLRDFVGGYGYGEAPAQLLRDLRAGMREAALHRIHTIRGVAGNLGAKELTAAATALEMACRTAGDVIPFSLGEQLRVFIDCHETLMMAIGTILAKHPSALSGKSVKPKGPPGDMAELLPLLEELKKALDSDEPLPCKKMMAALLQRRWPEDQETLLAEVNRLLQRYRLPEALKLLNKGVAK